MTNTINTLDDIVQEAKSFESPVTVLLCGVGGQGTILAADLLAQTAMAAGLQVKLAEVHGMAQRGGAVTTIVRFGKQVASMVTDPGCADYVVAFETTEALRNLPYLKSGGNLLVSKETIKPLSVLAGNAKMPKNAEGDLLSRGATIIPAVELAVDAGNIKCSNVVLLGALARVLGISPALWEEQIEKRLPQKIVEVNKKSFHAGFSYEDNSSKG